MRLFCPLCDRELKPEDVNLAKDTGYCPVCKEMFSLTPLMEAVNNEEDHQEDAELLRKGPPKGVTLKQDGREIIVIAHQSRAICLFLIPFMCFWSGLSLGGIYGTQIYKGEFQLGASLFGIPFLLGTALMLGAILHSLFGTVMLRIHENGIILRSSKFRSLSIDSTRSDLFAVGNPNTKQNGQWAWSELKAVKLLQNKSSRHEYDTNGGDDDEVDLRTAICLPTLPYSRQRFLLAVVREAAYRKGIRLNLL